MKGGDISNQFGTAIAIDVDDLIIETIKPKSIFGKKKIELLPGVMALMNRIFRGDISIYITCIRENPKEALAIQEFLDEQYLPYSRFYKLKKPSALHQVLELPYITTYYYRDMTHTPPLGTVNKAVRVESILEGI